MRVCPVYTWICNKKKKHADFGNIIIMGKWFLGSPGFRGAAVAIIIIKPTIRRVRYIRWRSTVRIMYILYTYMYWVSGCIYIMHTRNTVDLDCVRTIHGYRVIDMFGWCIPVDEVFAQKQLPRVSYAPYVWVGSYIHSHTHAHTHMQAIKERKRE